MSVQDGSFRGAAGKKGCPCPPRLSAVVQESASRLSRACAWSRYTAHGCSVIRSRPRRVVALARPAPTISSVTDARQSSISLRMPGAELDLHVVKAEGPRRMRWHEADEPRAPRPQRLLGGAVTMWASSWCEVAHAEKDRAGRRSSRGDAPGRVRPGAAAGSR